MRMDLLTRPQGISLPLAPLAAATGAFASALIAGTLPGALLEGLVNASGLPAVIDAAAPPLGITARLLLAIATAALVGAALLPIASFRFGRRRLRVRSAPRVVRPHRAPAAAPARPISAHEELGAPFLSVRAAGDETAARPVSAPTAAPVAVTETVEVADRVFIADRRRHPRTALRRSAPQPPLHDTVSGLLERLEGAIVSGDFSPRRPIDSGLRAAIHSLAGLRRTA